MHFSNLNRFPQTEALLYIYRVTFEIHRNRLDFVSRCDPLTPSERLELSFLEFVHGVRVGEGAI